MDPVGFFGINRTAGKNQIRCPRITDDSWQEKAHAGIRRQVAFDEYGLESRFIRTNPHVTSQRQTHPGPCRNTVHRRDDWFVEAMEAHCLTTDPAEIIQVLVLGGGVFFAWRSSEIRPGAKPTTCACDDDHPDVVIVPGFGQCVSITVLQFARQRVQFFRSIQRQDSDVVGLLVTTLQKFPFVLRGLLHAAGAESQEQATEEEKRQAKAWEAEIAKRRYAIIVDEAHSSQSGETARELKAILARRR